jgi:hypothetical protein
MICYAVNLLFIYCMMRSKCSHPKLLVDTYNTKKACNEAVGEELEALVRIITSHTAAGASTALQGGGGSGGGGGGEGGGGSSGAAGRTGGVVSLLTRHSLNNPLAALANKSFSLKGGGKSGGGGGGGGERIDPDLSGMLLHKEGSCVIQVY